MIDETLELMLSPTWMASANCRSSDPNLFYPTEAGKWSKFSMKAAFKICGKCPVKTECLMWAFEIGDIHGILGGTTPEMRKTMLKGAA